MSALGRRFKKRLKKSGLLNTGQASIGYVSKRLRYVLSGKYPIRYTFNAMRLGFNPDNYFFLGIPSKGPENYITSAEEFPEYQGGYERIFDNKYAFHLANSEFKSYMPNLYGSIEKGHFYPLETEAEDLETVLDKAGKIVLKPVYKSKGKGVYVVSEDVIDSVPVHEFDNYIVTEFVQQEEYAENIFEEAANSIRITTIRDPKTGHAVPVRAAHRFGSRESAPIDNVSAGGYCANIDIATGELGEIISIANSTERVRHDTHPDSGAPVAGVKVPHWEETKDVIEQISNMHRPAIVVGWDVIITEQGPVVIEANSVPDITLFQVEEGLLTEPIAKRLIGQQ